MNIQQQHPSLSIKTWEQKQRSKSNPQQTNLEQNLMTMSRRSMTWEKKQKSKFMTTQQHIPANTSPSIKTW